MVKKKSIEEAKSVPEGVKILSVFCYIGALISFIAGGFMFSISDNLSQDPSIFIQQGLEAPTPITLISAGILLLGFAVIYYVIAKDLLKLKNWARIVIVVFSALGIITAITNLTKQLFASGLFSLVVNGLIIWYLMFREKTKKAFK